MLNIYYYCQVWYLFLKNKNLCHHTFLTLLQSKIFNDSIHKTVELNPVEIAIIQTPEFFRLKNIKQLGMLEKYEMYRVF